MKTIILPGFSSKNKDWAYDIASNLKLGHEMVVIEWEHWKKGNNYFARNKELSKCLEIIKNEDVNLIGKSVGVGVALDLIRIISKQINKLILCGIPLSGYDDERIKVFKEVLSSIKRENVTIFQNESDPLGSYEKVSEMLKINHLEIKIIKKNRSDHNYPYAEDFQNILKPH